MTYVEDVITTTLCINCEHFISRGPIWYHHFCGAPEVQAKEGIDPITGDTGFVKQNDLGIKYFDDKSEPYARDINNGSCPHFTNKKEYLLCQRKNNL
jgi:hypothetical protein